MKYDEYRYTIYDSDNRRIGVAFLVVLALMITFMLCCISVNKRIENKPVDKSLYTVEDTIKYAFGGRYEAP